MASRYPDKQTGEKGWYCNKKADGCGASFPPADTRILEQEAGRQEHPDPAELWHTCSMMAQKRWMVAITRRTFALSARFIDAEAAREGHFDWKHAAPLLRALPGEKEEKWNRVIVECLRQFGKAPEDITNLEGSVVMSWLSALIDAGSALSREDFMESPEAPPRKPATAEPEKPVPSKKPSPEDLKEAEDDLKALDLFDEFVKDRGLPVDWTQWDVKAAFALIEESRP